MSDNFLSPLDHVILSACILGDRLGLSSEEVATELTSNIKEKQNRYKWREKIKKLQKVSPEDTRCKYTGDFLQDLDL